MADYICNWCGKSASRSGNYNSTPNGWVWNKTYGFGKKVYCSNSCKKEGEESPKTFDNTSQKLSDIDDDHKDEKKSTGFLSGFESVGSSKRSKTFDLLDSVISDNMNQEKENRLKIDSISKIIFSDNINELSNQMNEIHTVGAGTNKEFKELRNACYEKMDFGIMKLKSLSANTEADFFSEKRKALKPKGFFGF